MIDRRFPTLWSAQETGPYVVRDHNGQQLAYVYFEDESRREQHPTLTLAEAMDANCGGTVAWRCCAWRS
jgi:hypothetical protein